MTVAHQYVNHTIYFMIISLIIFGQFFSCLPASESSDLYVILIQFFCVFAEILLSWFYFNFSAGGVCGVSAVCTFVFQFFLRLTSTVVILAQCFRVCDGPLLLWFCLMFLHLRWALKKFDLGSFSVYAEILYPYDFVFFAIAVDLCYHVYEGHVWWYFPIII